jgi:tetratricopeptide (TPR) repeat protein
VALCQKHLAAVYGQQNDMTASLEHLRAAETIDRERLKWEPASGEAMMDLSFDLSDMGNALVGPGQSQEQVRAYEEALVLRRAVLAQDPHDYRARHACGRSLNRLAQAYLDGGKVDRAIATSQEAVTTLAAVSVHDPANRSALRDYAFASADLGRFYQQRGRPEDRLAALASYERTASLLPPLRDGAGLTALDKSRIAEISEAIEESRRKAALRVGRR